MQLALREIQPATDEQALVRAVRSGDDRAFEQLFSRYRRRISGYVYALVGDYGRAEDITQEVFISALRRLRASDQSIAFKPWIYEIARNACIDEFRRSRRATVVPLDDEQAERALYSSAPADTPEVRWERKQRLNNLFGAFSGLSENHHQVLVLRELEGLSYSEIADRMGISKVMVESTLFRARRRLSQEYSELESGRRCQDVRTVLDGHRARALAGLGVRERRRIASHLGHCHDCLRHARLAGIDRDALQVPSVARRVAAILPLGWLPAALRRGAEAASRHRGGALSARTAQRTAAMSDTASPAVAFGRALAAAAALIVVGSGLPAHSPSRQPRPVPGRAQAAQGAPARSASRAPGRHPDARPAARTPSRHRSAPAGGQAHRTMHRSQRTPQRAAPPSRGGGPSTPAAAPPHSGSPLPVPPTPLTVPPTPLPGAPVLPATPSLPSAQGVLGSLTGQGAGPLLAPATQAVNQAAGIAGAATTVTQQAATTVLQQTAAAAGAATTTLQSLPPVPGG